MLLCRLLFIFLISFVFNSVSQSSPIYTFSENADSLIKLAFPTNLQIKGLMKAWLERKQSPRFSSFADLLEFNIHGVHPGNTNISRFTIPQDHIDSVWFWKLTPNEEAGFDEFLKQSPKILTILERLNSEAFHFNSLFEKFIIIDKFFI